MIEVFAICKANRAATGHMWLLSTWYVASTTEKLNFDFYFAVNHFQVKSKYTYVNIATVPGHTMLNDKISDIMTGS